MGRSTGEGHDEAAHSSDLEDDCVFQPIVITDSRPS